MIVEFDADRAVHWMSPSDATEQEILDLGTAPRLPHSGGAHAVCVSGRVVFLTADSTPGQLRALMSIAGNDDAIAGEAN
jgi:hypothetical protein